MKPNMLIALFLLLVFAANAAFTQDSNNGESLGSGTSNEEKIINAFSFYCLSNLAAGNDVAHVAEEKNLPRFKPEAEAPLLFGKPGKVFGLPQVVGAALMAPEVPVCSIAIKTLNAEEFVKRIGYWLGSKDSPFSLSQNRQLEDGGIELQYEGVMEGTKLSIFAKVSPVVPASGIQALIGAGRAGSK